MMDIFLRAETPGALRTVVKSNPFKAIIGDLTPDPDDATNLRIIGGSVVHVYFPPNSVLVTPGNPPVMDSWCWLHLRLSGPAEASDFDAGSGNVETDRWNKSRLRKWMQNNGTRRTIRGVTVYERRQGGKRVQVWRGKEMAEKGILFHEFSGGNSY